ncbi:unnamed protein product [Adineta steineri]|uniref:G-protein coupled receptors family 1 profile domain-containing protein n=1 Tax=Adineta steineri TaxID=433720 RepID=A0A820E1F6_9BILA|nr:unnamed protein product [Adineta steineri]CAF4239606.1 unnamed protein product [Adineta steineri]
MSNYSGNIQSNGKYRTKFILLLLFSIPSVICALYVVYNVVKLRSFRRRFQNQILIILVFIILFNIVFNIPTSFSFFVRGTVAIHTEWFCRFWQSIDYFLTACVLWCTAIFTIQRYIFVFYPIYIRSKRQKLIFHYIPLVLINIYLLLFYVLTISIDICHNGKHREIIYDKFLCGENCLDREGGISMFNWLFNILFPVFFVIFGSLMLLIRVLWTRRMMQRNLRNWSKNWKMITQLLGIASIYTLVWIPLIIISFILIVNENHAFSKSVEDYLYFITYLCELCVPIVVLLLSSELIQSLNRRIWPNFNSMQSVTIGPYSTNVE